MTRTSICCPKLLLAMIFIGLTTVNGCAGTRQARVGDESARKNATTISPAASPNPIVESAIATEAGIVAAGMRLDRNIDAVGMRTATEPATRNVTDDSVESCDSEGCGQCSR